MTHEQTTTAAYALTLSRLKGVGRRTVVAALRAFPTEQQLREASDPTIAAAVGKRAAGALARVSDASWTVAADWAARHIEQHETAGVVLVPFGSSGYPSLLAVAPDPPFLLYVRGHVSALTSPLPIAVVGTREPTDRGIEIARRLSQRLAEAGVVIVSGLAKGIDTAGHEGALSAADGRSVAVLGTSIDKVYPAANRALASQLAAAGALVSEYPMGADNRASMFVERDRIQAGLSLAVVPVQTGLSGGTQHTIRAAQEAGRLLLCPPPDAKETDVPQMAGVKALLERGACEPLDVAAIPSLLDRLSQVRTALLDDALTQGERGAGPGADDQLSWLRPHTGERGASAHSSGPVSAQMIIDELDPVLDRLAPNFDERGFDALIRTWRAQRFPRTKDE